MDGEGILEMDTTGKKGERHDLEKRSGRCGNRYWLFNIPDELLAAILAIAEFLPAEKVPHFLGKFLATARAIERFHSCSRTIGFGRIFQAMGAGSHAFKSNLRSHCPACPAFFPSLFPEHCHFPGARFSITPWGYQVTILGWIASLEKAINILEGGVPLHRDFLPIGIKDHY